MGKVSNLLSIKFDNESVYDDNDKYIKTKTKLYGNKVNTNFQGKKIPKRNAAYSAETLLSVIRANKKYYAQTLLE